MDIFYPVQMFADWLTVSIWGSGGDRVWIGAFNFFVYDSIKILILLSVIIFVVSFLRSYLPAEKTRKWLVNRLGIVGNIIASLIGIVTPFCSCSAVPLFIGLVESGVPLGVTFSYLVSAPMVNEVAAVMLLGLFGPTIALLYVGSGVLMAIMVGFIIGKLKLENWVEDYVWKIKVGQNRMVIEKGLRDRLTESYVYTRDLVKKVFPYVLIGIGAGALIHGYAPEDVLARIAGKNNFFAVPLAVLVGIPLYSNAAGTIPIVSSLIEKGLPIGTSLAFMMSVTALSFPEMIILRKVLKPKLLAIYIAILAIGIIFTGYLFNIIL